MRVPTSLQQETWLRSLSTGGRLRAMPALLQVEGEFDLARFRAAVASMTAAHDTLRSTFQPEEPLWSEVAEPGETSTDVLELDAGEDPSVWVRVREYMTQPFPLDEPRRVRTVIARTAPDTYMLGLAADHLAMDGLSLRLLARDLLSRYFALEPGSNRKMPKAYSYASFATRQRDLLATEWGTQRREFWFGHFDRWGPNQPGSPLAVPPADGSGPSADQTMVLQAALGPQTIRTLDDMALRVGSTRFGVLSAAISRTQLLSSDRKSAGVVCDFHGRVLPLTWSTLGLFSHGLSLFLGREEAGDLHEAVRLLTGRLDDARRLGIPLRPMAGQWLAERGEQHRYGEPHYIYLGVRPRLKRYLPDDSKLRAVPVDVGQVINQALGYFSLLLGGTTESPMLQGRFDGGLFPTATIESFIHETFASLGPVPDLEITTVPRAAAPAPAPA
ncbi:MAG TPA: condensation domain-containing protein [Candidatus Limnocylindrales bacterium]|nr:condensation domain-containing protein [Candidatus Limnocylindrales bacterium]